LGDVRGIVPAHRHCHQNGQTFWFIFSLMICLLFSWRLLGECGASSCPMVASVAFGVALDMLHWAMCFVLHQQIAMAIKTANDGGTC
jgi:hypothetical protein